MDLRPYQNEARRGIYSSLKEYSSTLAVLATGLGKTVVFSSIAEDAAKKGRRVLILAHREELVTQAADKFQRVSGLRAAVEMGPRREGMAPANMELIPGVAPPAGSEFPSVVVSSVQTMVRRLDKFPADHFHLLVIDEAHHAPATTYRKIIDHFDAKVLGVTATPDRGDKKALGQVFEDVAFRYDIQNAISDGWLCPIRQQYVQAENLDLSRCRTTAGDLNSGDLEAAMSEMKVLEQIAGPTIDAAGDRPTLLFAVTVAHAHALAEVLRGHTKHDVRALDGTTDRDERREVVEAFRNGEIRYLVNCALFTEGFDAPSTALVAMARPTKSRSLYEQMIGRGTRTLDGTLDRLGDSVAEVRRAAIANSAKPDLLVLDFVGNSGKHNLVSMIDVLAGDASTPEKSIAKGLMEKGEVEDVAEAIRIARSQIEQMELDKLRRTARKNYRTVQVDPFMAFGIESRGEDMLGKEASAKQREVLERAGINPAGIDRTQASRLISSMIARRSGNLATFKQVNRLVKTGLDHKVASRLSFTQASGLITKLAENKWRKPGNWDRLVAEVTR